MEEIKNLEGGQGLSGREKSRRIGEIKKQFYSYGKKQLTARLISVNEKPVLKG